MLSLHQQLVNLGIAETPNTWNIFVTKLKIINHVLTILDIKTKLQQIFISQVIGYIGKLINTKNDNWQYIVNKTHSKLFLVDIDQIFIFQKFHYNNFTKIPTNTEANILYNLTKQ